VSACSSLVYGTTWAKSQRYNKYDSKDTILCASGMKIFQADLNLNLNVGEILLISSKVSTYP
jgi:hypothetical protein